MLRSPYLLGSLLAGIMTGAPLRTAQVVGRTPPSSADSVTVRKYFDGMVSLLTKDGKTKTVRLVRQQWALNGGLKLAQFPQPGFLVVQLGAGSVTTVIDGKRKERQDDEFWTVPLGSVMAVEIRQEQAVLAELALTDR